MSCAKGYKYEEVSKCNFKFHFSYYVVFNGMYKRSKNIV